MRCSGLALSFFLFLSFSLYPRLWEFLSPVLRFPRWPHALTSHQYVSLHVLPFLRPFPTSLSVARSLSLSLHPTSVVDVAFWWVSFYFAGGHIPRALHFSQVGILDVDLCGPSLPRMFGVEDADIHTAADG